MTPPVGSIGGGVAVPVSLASAVAAVEAAAPVVTVRKARLADARAISALVNSFAAEDIMLPRSTEQVMLAVDDYVVAVDEDERLLACGALREYSPSLVELVSLAVAREAHGLGLGRSIVEAVECLARRRGFGSVFAHTLQPCFFRAVGYTEVSRALFPEKVARPHTSCFEKVFGVAAGAGERGAEVREAGSAGAARAARAA